MKDAVRLRWLYRELPELVGQGVIPPEIAERIRQHYGEPELAGSAAKRWAIVLFSVLGSALIGGGIILLLAHNWEDLSRPARAIISIAPLAIAAALGLWLLWTERESAAWREGVGAAQALAIGASIALVAQTYNLGGRFDEFMLTWALLALPIAYLLRSTLPMVLYLVGIAVWTGSVTYWPGVGLWYFPLLAAALPFLWWTGRENRYHPRPVLLGWTLAITVCVGAGFALGRVCDKLDAWPVLFGGLFAALYLIGTRWRGEAPSVWQRPFQNVGALGAVGLSLVLSFKEVWSRAGWRYYWEDADFSLAGARLAVAAIFPIAALALWVWSWRRQAWGEIMLGVVAPLVIVGWVASMYDAVEMLRSALFTLYLFVLGIGTLVVGFRGQRLGAVNAGLAVLAAVVLCRFFDSDLSFLVRGVAFIVIGVGFLATNLALSRRKGAVK